MGARHMLKFAAASAAIAALGVGVSITDASAQE